MEGAKNISVAIVCTSLNQVGGKSVHFKNMYLKFRENGLRVAIIITSSLEKEYADFFLREGVSRQDLFFISKRKKWLILPYAFELKDILTRRGVDIVHTFQMQSDIFGSLAAFLAGGKRVVSQQESKIFEENISFFKVLFYRLANFFMKGFIKKTIAVSKALKEEIVSEGLRPKEKIEVIPLGVSIPEEYRKEEFSFKGLKEGRPLIGSITRLSKEKGMERFIEAMPYILRKAPGSRFLIVGMGDEERALKKDVSSLGLEGAVEFKSWTNPIYDILEGIDIFVMPSLREGCPTALLEALAFSRPVVASNVGGINEIIEDGKNGIMTDTANPELFAEKVLYFCMNTQEALRMGEEGRSRVLRDFTLDEEIAHHIRLYEEVLEDTLER